MLSEILSGINPSELYHLLEEKVEKALEVHPKFEPLLKMSLRRIKKSFDNNDRKAYIRARHYNEFLDDITKNPNYFDFILTAEVGQEVTIPEHMVDKMWGYMCDMIGGDLERIDQVIQESRKDAWKTYSLGR